MDERFATLLDAFVRAAKPEPAALASALRNLPEPGALPSPWETWTLIGLVRHRERQLWVDDIIRYRLRGGPSDNDLPDVGDLWQPEGIPLSGPVPGMPEWEYCFYGKACLLTHKLDGDTIEVDFWEDSAEFIGTDIYSIYLKSLRRPEPLEQRLLELHPTARTISIVIVDLLTANALTPLWCNRPEFYRLSDGVLAAIETIDAFCTAWEDPQRRLWLAALIGDWLAADEAASGRADLKAITGPRAEKCRELRRARLDLDLQEPSRGWDSLQALADLKAPDLEQRLEDFLRAPRNGKLSRALDVIEKLDDPTWCERVHDLLARIDPNGAGYWPINWIIALKFLFRHGHRTQEMLAALAKAGPWEIGEAVLLSLEYAPEMALPLIRKRFCPLSKTDYEVAAILAVIGKPWCFQELLRAVVSRIARCDAIENVTHRRYTHNLHAIMLAG